jgi:hypothetical protein
MATYALSIKQNFNNNELTAVLTTSEAGGLADVAAKFFIEAYTSVGSRITQAMSGDTTAAKQITISLGNSFDNGTQYTVRSIGMDANGAPVADQTLTQTVTYRSPPGTVSIALSSDSATITAAVSDLIAASTSGDAIDHFLVQVVNTQQAGGTSTGFAKVDRADTNADSQNVIDGANTFAGVDFNTGDSVTVTVTPFATVGGSGAEVSGSTTLSAVPNAFALTVAQPLSAGPSVPSFSFAAEDSNPIAGQAITGLSLTISQDGVADQVVDLFNSGNWAAPNLAAVTITDGVDGITLTAGNEITLSFVATNGQGSSTAQTSFTYNGVADTSSFTAQSEVTFTSLVTAANLADAIVSRDIVNDNEITANLNSSSNLAGQALTALYNANGTSVALSLSVVDPNNNNAVISAAQALNALDQTVTFDLGLNNGAKWDSIALLLTATSTYDAQANTSITQVSDSINLINALLTMSVSSVQPAKGSTSLTGTLTVDATTDNKPSFVSGTASLYLDKNNSGNALDLSSLAANDVMLVASKTISSLTDNQASIEFTNLPDSIDGHGLYISVSATQTADDAETHDIATATSSANKRYKFSSSVLSYSAGDATATITSNGNTLATAVDIDLTSGEQELRILYNDGANDEGTVDNNVGFNYLFTDPANNDDKEARSIELAGIETSAETLLVFLQQANVALQGEHLVGGSASLNA